MLGVGRVDESFLEAAKCKYLATQRARVKITEEVLRRYVAGAGTPSYGFRRRLMHVLDVVLSF